LREISVAVRLAPEDPDEHNMKAIICAEMGDFLSTRDEWTHLVQASPGYIPARVNLAILTDSRMPKPPSTSKVSDQFAVAR
jgi:Flp pilus assembly protein TadD